MHDDTEDDDQKRSPIVCAGAVPVVLVFYVLSVGPVLWTLDNTKLLDRAEVFGIVDTFYYPLSTLYESSEVAERCFDWHFELWEL